MAVALFGHPHRAEEASQGGDDGQQHKADNVGRYADYFADGGGPPYLGGSRLSSCFSGVISGMGVFLELWEAKG